MEWFEQLPCAVTVCGKDYTILYMNEKAAEMNSKDGGKALVGKNLMDCHPPEARKKTRKIMASDRPNVYTIEKKGVKKLIFQGQWKKGGRTAGLVELVIELPENMPHFVRTSS
jgi:PAS domain-containing protein